jgi:hypothetical protein|tara:strand:- start:680 stop:1225 length:546 start_codon:yes stop_codon:yes gene_type:complete
MSTDNFWTNGPSVDPKRGFRFKVSIGTLGMLWMAKKVDRPTFSLTESKHEYLNHSFYWPARAEWSEVGMTLVDPTNPDIASSLLGFVATAGYNIIGQPQNDGELSSIGKSNAIAATGDITIEQINETGVTLETWTLKNAWIKEVDFSELDYSNDDLSEVTVKLRYDWAEFSGGGKSLFGLN